MARRTVAEVDEQLRAAGIDSPALLTELHKLAETNPVSLLDIRTCLEGLFRAVASLSRARRGVPFTGHSDRFVELREFLRAMEWLTPQEDRFVAAYYGLLSDAGVHGGQSHFDSDVARALLFYVAALVAGRLETPVPRSALPRAGGSGARHDVARDFLHFVRGGRMSRRAETTHFDQDLMDLTRRMLRPEDAQALLRLIKDPEVVDTLRNRCASLVLSPRCFRNAEARARAIDELRGFYESTAMTLPWQVSRAIALALANRANFAGPILEFTRGLSEDAAILEQNLAQSEHYYNTQREALAYYLERLGNPGIPAAGCAWEAFFVSYRCTNELKKTAVAALKRRAEQTESPELRVFFFAAASRLQERTR